TYENDAYLEAKKGIPEVGQIVKIKEGEGKVVSIEPLNGLYRVEIPELGIITVMKDNGSN
ncbi:MAG: stage 0 sporulation protein, partial [Bacilli bacterium]